MREVSETFVPWRSKHSISLLVAGSVAVAAIAGAVFLGRRDTRPATVARPVPFAGLQLAPAQQESLDHAEDVLTRNCMRGRGMDFTVAARTDRQPETPANPYGLLDPAEVARHGYGLRDTGQPPQDAPLPDRENDALFGTESHAKDIALPGGGQLVVRTDGCFYQAQTRLYGEDWKWLLYNEQTLYSRVVARVEEDSGVVSAQGSWADCMRQAGYHMTTMDRVWPDAQRRMDATGNDRVAGQAEFNRLLRQAKQDLACQQKSGVLTAIRRAQSDAERVVAAGQQDRLRELADLRSAALAAARQLADPG
jgi:uncharacterized membrane protein